MIKTAVLLFYGALSSETSATPARTQTLTAMAKFVRSMNDTRLVTSAINNAKVERDNVTIKSGTVKAC